MTILHLNGYSFIKIIQIQSSCLPMHHTGYYHGGMVMTMNVVFEKDSYRLYGVQIIGSDSVDKRIDMIATAIHAGMRATELKALLISLWMSWEKDWRKLKKKNTCMLCVKAA